MPSASRWHALCFPQEMAQPLGPVREPHGFASVEATYIPAKDDVVASLKPLAKNVAKVEQVGRSH